MLDFLSTKHFKTHKCMFSKAMTLRHMTSTNGCNEMEVIWNVKSTTRFFIARGHVLHDIQILQRNAKNWYALRKWWNLQGIWFIYDMIRNKNRLWWRYLAPILVSLKGDSALKHSGHSGELFVQIRFKLEIPSDFSICTIWFDFKHSKYSHQFVKFTLQLIN